MEHYGVSGTAKKWIVNYLSGRQLYVQIDNVHSGYEKVIHGIPQGSILGPRLFITCINDMCNASSFLKYVLFADDTTISRAGNDIKLLNKEVNHELIELSQWFSINKSSINLQKTQCMLLKNSKSFRNITITLSNVGIKQIHSARHLGVYIYDKLTWKDHLSYISNKLAKCISILHRVKWTLDSRALRLLYYTLALPYISYCAIIFGNTYYTNILPIFTKQKKI